ncbi:ABC transporter substrate-binding protein [Methylobacterium terricola]|uniref:ABC transporter substrate-binding protein n=1 Tax=Methylobacterium terricola TaxID=2583531 RepID=A0A5C4L8L1_9HYPH|nr:ABC transporter substrate-binding protein [Methylobacterium terricola]
MVFHMRRGAIFHDGTPVTARDAKWSLDRCMSVPTAKAQLASGSLRDPAQFSVIDDMTLQVETEKADRFTLPNLAIVFPAIFNSALCRKHATEADPFALDWLKANVAGGGPFRLARYEPGQQVILDRFPQWLNGKVAGKARILLQVATNASSRRAAAERGEADIVRGLSGRDVADLRASGRTRIVGVNNPASVAYVAMNTQMAPFDDRRVRQAVAYALPYRQMFDSALYGRGKPLFGGEAATVSAKWPVPLPYDTDLAKAKALLAEAGHAGGFETVFSIDAGQAALAEPVAVLLQESLGKVGIRVAISKVPGAQIGTLQAEKKLAMFLATGSAWLKSQDYFFRIFYTGKSRWNYGNFADPEMEALTMATRFETDPATYEAKVRRMVEIAKAEVPMVALWSPFLDVAVGKGLSGYTYMFHSALELRHLVKA